jgi:hypothetical protein
VEIMVLAFTLVVASSIILLGITITIITIVNPKINTESAATALFNLLTGMMGALLGLLAGKAEVVSQLHTRPPDKPEPEEPE